MTYFSLINKLVSQIVYNITYQNLELYTPTLTTPTVSVIISFINLIMHSMDWMIKYMAANGRTNVLKK